MATITGLTAERMLEIEAASIVDGDVDGSGNLILTKHDGSQINAGGVVGPAGPQGPVGSDTVVVSARSILDVGLANQIRAGRQLSPADFNALGLSAPIGLWNLGDLTDVSGNGRNLLNKGDISFGVGINGAASSAAQFVGSVAQALYIPDTGVNDPFRIKVGSLGCWFRTTNPGISQNLISKRSAAAGQYAYDFYIKAGTNQISMWISIDGTNVVGPSGITFISDDRWHFAVATYDGTFLRLYLDGMPEVSIQIAGMIFAASGPFNIGSDSADASTNAGIPFFGRIDEAFITADILTEDQVRNLYCAKISHTLGVIPSRLSLNIRRRRRGAAFVVADFPTQPLRLHNFSAGSLTDEGSNNVPFVTNVGSGVITPIAGVDGIPGNAYSFSGAHAGLSATDAGLPAALTARSVGAWFKTSSPTQFNMIITYGTITTGDLRLYVSNTGLLVSASGADLVTMSYVADGQWHFVVVVEDNTAADGLKRKIYLDGKLVAVSTTLGSIVLAGANRFRIGADPTGAFPMAGQIDTGFVCGYVLTLDQIVALYTKGVQTLAPSPKNVGDHVEAMSSTDLLAIFDTLDGVHQVDIKAAP